jgi:P27 family predicted phage terminase small subunit
MSRPSRPASLKLLTGRGNGTDSGGRKVTAGPDFRRIAPKPPTWLSTEAAAEWRRVVPGLQRLDLLKVEDRGTLTAYCETWSTFVTATRMIAAEGLTIEKTITTKDGRSFSQTYAHPAVAIARNAGKELRAWAGHFGLTPAAESALATAPDGAPGQGSNPFAGGDGAS